MSARAMRRAAKRGDKRRWKMLARQFPDIPERRLAELILLAERAEKANDGDSLRSIDADRR